MLLPFLVKNSHDKDGEFIEYLNTERIVSMIQTDSEAYEIEYEVEKHNIRHIDAVKIPERLLVYPDDESTCIKIFQGDSVDKLEQAFDHWAEDQSNLRIISMNTCVDKEFSLTISVVYTAEF